MSEVAAPIPSSSEATEVRFSMRSMLIATAAVAAGATALGMFLRRFPAEDQPRLLAFWGILLALLALFVGLNARRRYLAEKQSGPVYFQLRAHSYLFPRAPRIASTLAGTLLLAAGPAMWTLASLFAVEGDVDALKAFAWESLVAASISGAGITTLWWQRRIRLCEAGIVRRNEFLPWSDCVRFYWDACYPHVIVTEWEPIRFVTAQVPEEQRGAVARLISEKLAAGRNQTQPRVSGDGRNKARSACPDTIRETHPPELNGNLR